MEDKQPIPDQDTPQPEAPATSAKLPTPKQTLRSMKGQPHENDADPLHSGGGIPALDAEKDKAVNIVKSHDETAA